MRVASADGRAVLIHGEGIVDIAAASNGALPADPQLLYDHWDEVRALSERVARADAPLDVHALQAPVPRPRQVFAIGLNYAAHAAEAGLERPTFPPTFTKFPTCLTGPDATVELPSAFVDWEVELVVVMGRLAYEVAAGDGWRHVAGLTVGQDLSERIVQTRPPAPQFSLGKSFPGFGPIGPWVVTPDELDKPRRSRARLHRQRGGSAEEPHRRSDLRRGRTDPPPVVDHSVAAGRPHLHGHPVRRRRDAYAAPLPRPGRRARLHHRRHRHHPHPPRRQERPP